MKIIIYTLFGALFFLGLISISWRFFSERYSLPCPSWLGWMIELDNPFAKSTHSHTIIKHLKLETGIKVLDIGCGPGRLTIPIAKIIGSQGEILAVDMQAEMLSKIKEKAKKANLSNIRYLETKIGKKTLIQDHFDRALLISVLGEIPDKEKCLQEVFHALQPGGILIIAETIFDPHFQSKNKVFSLVTKIGFRLIETSGNFLSYNMLLEKPQ